MAFRDKHKMKMPSIKLAALLTLLFLLIGLIPIVIQSGVLIRSDESLLVEDRRLNVQNQCLILANSMSRNSYFSPTDTSSNDIINAEIETVADVYNGRIVIIDKSYKVIKDTFNIAVGRTNISTEILSCFEGVNSNNYNKVKQYIIQTIPIYDIQQEHVEGVLLITSSTENISSIIGSSLNRSRLFVLTAIVLLIAIGLLLGKWITIPFYRLNKSIGKIADGDLSTTLDEDSYVITKQMSAAVNESLSKIRAADQSRDEFVSNVSHELKTPITSIRVLADSLMSMEDAPVDLYKEFMDDISTEIDRESKIIDDLLSLVKLDKDHIKLVTEPIDINAMLEQILKRLRPIAGKRNIEITFESIREVTADVDETKLSLAVSNIVENAIKYNKDAGSVHVTLDADHQFFYIKVADTGVGIPEELQESIFERFYRVDKARSRETGGTGLGLSITKNIILMHHGVVKVTGNEDEGSTFTIRIPLNYIEVEKE